MFVGDPQPPEFADRLAGFEAAAREAGTFVEVLATAMIPEAVHAAVSARLANGSSLEGIFAASDVAAMSVLRALAEAGVDVPGTTAVIGYDDVTLAAHTSPPLTTIRQDLALGAELMVDRLMKRISGEPAESAIVPPTLVIRQSA
jgi:DNA-binding LacI/PurR family transcriptional regulator